MNRDYIIEEMEDTITAYEIQNEQLQGQLEDSEIDVRDLEEIIKDLKAKITELKEENAKLSSTNEELEYKLKQEIKDNNITKRNILDIESRYNEALLDFDRLNSSVFGRDAKKDDNYFDY